MQAIFFWIFALFTVTGAIATITRRNAITAVMCLVGTIIALAALFAMLFAHFLAIIQILVYAGAIMVLFVFVIMILNKEEEEPWALRGFVGKLLAGVFLGYLLYRLVDTVWSYPARAAAPAPGPEALGDYGTVAAVGKVLFTTYLFPFEAISLVLLIAVVGAIVLGRAHPRHPEKLAAAGQAGDAAPQPETAH